MSASIEPGRECATFVASPGEMKISSLTQPTRTWSYTGTPVIPQTSSHISAVATIRPMLSEKWNMEEQYSRNCAFGARVASHLVWPCHPVTRVIQLVLGPSYDDLFDQAVLRGRRASPWDAFTLRLSTSEKARALLQQNLHRSATVLGPRWDLSLDFGASFRRSLSGNEETPFRTQADLRASTEVAPVTTAMSLALDEYTGSRVRPGRSVEPGAIPDFRRQGPSTQYGAVCAPVQCQPQDIQRQADKSSIEYRSAFTNRKSSAIAKLMPDHKISYRSTASQTAQAGADPAPDPPKKILAGATLLGDGNLETLAAGGSLSVRSTEFHPSIGRASSFDTSLNS